MKINLKYILFYTSITMAFFSFQNVYGKKIMTCLGHEELILHKTKNTGPIYKLNQLLIDTFASYGNIKIKKIYLRKICITPNKITYTNGSSFTFLKLLLLKGENIFELDKIEGQVGTKNYIKNNIKNFANNTSVHIFFDYLSTLNSLLKSAHCLDKKIPEIKYFRDRFRYLEANYSTRKLVSEKKKLKRIIKGLKSFDKIKRNCSMKKSRN